jgi:hypothetical protein
MILPKDLRELIVAMIDAAARREQKSKGRK